MPVFYHSASMLITDRLFKIRGIPDQVFSIDQIQQVYAVRADVQLPRQPIPVRLWLAGAAVILSTVIAVIEISTRPRSLQLIAAVALVICGVTILVSPVRARPVNELWAVYEGHHRCLCREPDDRIFGQIQRALLRAREHGAHWERDR